MLLRGCPDDAVAEACAERLLKGIRVAKVFGAPDEPGRWFWTEWNCEVEVYKKPRGKYLYVTPPGGVEIRITDKIAGGWRIALPQSSPSSGVPHS
jgi:hypothetical protein